jgi:hypothetical protein
MATLPVSRVVNVNVNLSPLGAKSQSLSDLLILGRSTFLSDLGERFRYYSDSASIAADFGATSAEYHASLLWFSQTPQPRQLIIGYWSGSPATVAAEVAEYDDELGQGWYALSVLTQKSGGTQADLSTADQLLVHLAVAPFIESSLNKHIYVVSTEDTQCYTFATPGTETDIASKLKALNIKRTLLQFSSTNQFVAISAAARILTTDYSQSNSVITLKFKQEPTVPSERFTTNQANVLESRNCNVFVQYNNDTSILEQGVMVNGMYVDEVTGTDWLAVQLQTTIYDVLFTNPTKIPQTDPGQHILTTAAESVCSRAVNNGMIAPGVWNSGGFGQLKTGDYLPSGYYVYSDSYDRQLPNDRARRYAMPIQIAVKLAGAVHDVNLSVLVNR